jgi:hypothetical protein
LGSRNLLFVGCVAEVAAPVWLLVCGASSSHSNRRSPSSSATSALDVLRRLPPPRHLLQEVPTMQENKTLLFGVSILVKLKRPL